MRNGAILLALVLALVTARAISQEIVIEPTNGKAASASKTRINRPGAVTVQNDQSATRVAAPKASAPEPEKRAAKAPSAEPRQHSAVVSRKATSTKKDVRAAEKKPAATATPKAPEPVVATSTPAPAAPPKPARPEWAAEDRRDPQTLQSQIQNAFKADPLLASTGLRVHVDENTVTLDGTASTGQEQVQAQRLVQSYAYNRKVVDKSNVMRAQAATR